ncbi:MAG: Gfo/Idh/MocA family oxidoreductase [Gemmatimonadetes bacterium]|nr:Gfo/Idh/MocA family oxidoreductase [Gemmatimonadota bacterium]
MSDRRYRGGAIGRTGRGNYGHGLHLGLAGADAVDLVALADPDPQGRREAAEAVGVERTYEDYREMLNKEALQIVTVGPRWVDCHEEMVLACVDAGCHVYCEKPMAHSLESADRMVDAAELAGVKLAVAHQGVYLPQVQAAKRMLEAGHIGPLQAIYATGKQDHRGGGEDMIVLGTHLFNLMRFLAGDVAWMSAQVTVGDRELRPGDAREAAEPVGLIAGDRIHSCFAFENGAAGYFVSRADQPGNGECFGLELVGRDGRFMMRGGAPTLIAAYPYSVWLPEDETRVWNVLDLETVPFADGNRLAVLDLIDAIEHDRQPLSSGVDAVKALEMVLGAYASQISGARVAFPMSERTHPLARYA